MNAAEMTGYGLCLLIGVFYHRSMMYYGIVIALLLIAGLSRLVYRNMQTINHNDSITECSISYW